MKLIFWIPLFIVVASHIAYHWSQKTTPSNANPLIAIGVSYLVALLLIPLAMVYFNEGLSRFNILGIAFAILGLALMSA